MSRGPGSTLALIVRSTVALLALLAALPTAALAGRADHSTSRSATAELDLGVLEQLNQIRAEHGLAALTLSPQLSAAARAHSRDMVANGYFDHSSADGTAFWKRIRVYYPERAGGWTVGENILWTSGSTTADASMRAWMGSPEHRANILDPAWRQIGIGAATSSSAPGTYGGLDVTVITTDFGARG